MWAITGRIQLRGALSSQIALQAFAPAHARFTARPFSSGLASASLAASASANFCRLGIQKPPIIQWHEDMPSNKATFIGTLARELRIQYLSSGKIVGSSSLRVKWFPDRFSWFYLEIWDDLAEVAAAHLKMGDRIFVSGSVWQESIIGKDGLEKIFAKVVVKDLKLIKLDPLEYLTSFQSHKMKSEKLWNDLFANRVDWADFRRNKKSKNDPDFRHKKLHTPLWIDNKLTPDWAKERLMIEGPGLSHN